MYQSRYHYNNGVISLALDSLTGELLEFVDQRSGENLIKNSSYHLRQPFQLTVQEGGEPKRLFGGNVYEIAEDKRLAPDISHTEQEDGCLVIKVSFTHLTDGETSYQTPLSYTITIPAGTAETRWELQLENAQPDSEIHQVRFPCINGIYFGSHWSGDRLLFPFQAGLNIENPIITFAQPKNNIFWKWQEYRYVYGIGSPAYGPDEDNLYVLESGFSGNLSMNWMAYSNDKQTLYFASTNTKPEILTLRADTYGETSPGMNLSAAHVPCVKTGEGWRSEPVLVSLLEGDWHVAADTYRTFRQENNLDKTPPRPQWFDKSPGLVAHYDFKYQGGGVVHTYEDIPTLYEQAQDMGLSHLLLSGWHYDGFDHGFPEYYPDDEMGTEQQLAENIRAVTNQGGHVSFYINARLVNRKYDHLQQFIKDNVIHRADGSELEERYGNDDLVFGAMCINTDGWQDKLVETLRYTTQELGIDGVYLDQIAMAPALPCYHPDHNHTTEDWNIGYQQLLDKIITQQAAYDEQPLSILHEGASNAYGHQSSGQLISTFSYHHIGAFPEMYRYTHPDHILVDMLYPESNMAMRPVHIGQVSTLLINRAFTLGMYYWIYDLVDDNTFTRDSKQYAYLKDVIALRQHWLDQYGHGIYLDNRYIHTTADGFWAKTYALSEDILLAVANDKEMPQTIELEMDRPAQVRIITVRDGRITVSNPPWMYRNHQLTITLPKTNQPSVLLLELTLS